MKKLMKGAIGISCIYIVAVLLSLVFCDRINELESREDQQIYAKELSLQLL